MRCTHFIKSIVGAFILVPTVVLADEQAASVFVLANHVDQNNRQIALGKYAEVDTKLNEFLSAQNLNVTSSFSATHSVPNFSNEFVLQAIRSANLSENDFAIVYSIDVEVEQSDMAREIRIGSEGDIFNAGTRELLTSFDIPIGETIEVSRNKNDCPESCISEALSGLIDDLTREMSFVLAQKISFIQEDRVAVDTSSSMEISERLSARQNQVPVSRTLITGSGIFDVDISRSLSMDIHFEFDSSELTHDAIEQLRPLGEALILTDLSSARFLISGHTDAKGSTEYNQALSENRALAVRNHLINHFNIPPSALISVGLGETQLKRPFEPNADVNRRVEIGYIIAENRANDRSEPVLNSFTLYLKLFRTSDALRIVRSLESNHVREIELLQSTSTLRAYSVETYLSSMQFETALLKLMADLGVNVDRIKIEILGSVISVEAL